MGKWKVSGEVGEIDVFRNYLGAPPRNRAGPGLGSFGWIFTRPDHSGRRRKGVQVRKSGAKWDGGEIGCLLFGGTAKFSNYFREEATVDSESFITLQLDLNPTRFLRHQSDQSLEEISLFRQENDESEEESEYSLDRNDNWIVNPGASNELPPSECFQRYLEAVVSGWEGEAERASELAHVSFERIEEKLNLKSIETYWEYEVNDPTGLVKGLKEPLEGYCGRSFLTRDYPAFLEEVGQEVNSQFIALGKRNGVTIKVYAKTNKRIRFEVYFQLSGKKAYRDFDGHTLQAWNVEALAMKAAIKSSEQIRDVFRHLQKCRKVSADAAPPYELLFAVTSKAESSQDALDILSLLIHNNHISVSKSDRLYGAVRALKRAGVVWNALHGPTASLGALWEPWRCCRRMLLNSPRWREGDLQVDAPFPFPRMDQGERNISYKRCDKGSRQLSICLASISWISCCEEKSLASSIRVLSSRSK
ncbi:hypothetical protein VSU19_10165 [Verrucomicrobiales bacterium BCK34]|nr:hypothetical protein [Verrucomicrobiales bacterium BCK34]